jgi:proteasome lid subunit RPN8/RPN11
VFDALEIRDTTVQAILAHARAAAPNECCGLLIGVGTTIRRSVAATNLAPGPTSYLIDPADHFAAIRAARAEECDVIGAYHSHPNAEAIPSRRDIAEAVGPAFIHLIVSVGPGGQFDMKAYRIADGSVDAVPLRHVSDPGMDSRR